MGGRKNFEKGIIDGKSKVLVSFSRVRSEQTAASAPVSFPPNASGQDFDTAILFKIVQRPNKYVFRVKPSPHNWSRGYKLYRLLCVSK